MSAVKKSTGDLRFAVVQRGARNAYPALATLLSDGQLHAELAQEGRARAAEFTTWTRSAERLKTCFEELL